MATPFRALQVADASEVFELLRAIYEKPPYPLGGSWTLRTVEVELDAQKGFGLFEQGRLVAVVLLREIEQAWDIIMLATDAGRQRRGDMTRLLGHVATVKPSSRELWLEVHEKNLPAINLYKKLGFRQVGRRPGYYRDGGAAVLYALR